MADPQEPATCEDEAKGEGWKLMKVEGGDPDAYKSERTCQPLGDDIQSITQHFLGMFKMNPYPCNVFDKRFDGADSSYFAFVCNVNGQESATTYEHIKLSGDDLIVAWEFGDGSLGKGSLTYTRCQP